MGRNLKDFYESNTGIAPEGYGVYRADVKGEDGKGAVIERRGKNIVATPDNAEPEVGRKVTRNRDTKKQGNRIAEVAVGNKPRLRGDK